VCWTLWDGFQTQPNRWKPLPHSGFRTIDTTTALTKAAPIAPLPAPSGRRRRKRESRQTPFSGDSPADVDELIAAYCAGTGISELGMRFRLHRTAVAAHLGRHCVERHGIAKAWTEDVLATAAALYESGRSLAPVGAALGVDASTVANRFFTAGVPIRAPIAVALVPIRSQSTPIARST